MGVGYGLYMYLRNGARQLLIAPTV